MREYPNQQARIMIQNAQRRSYSDFVKSSLVVALHETEYLHVQCQSESVWPLR